MIEICVNEIPFFEFPNLSGIPEIRHGVFTRRGGYSEGPFASLNVGISVQDSPAHVAQNRQAIGRIMGNANLLFIHQVHGAAVIVYSRNAEGEKNIAPVTPQVGDAVISNVPGVTLAIQTADCQSILLYDPIRGAVGNVHSGWRGSIQNIIGQTVEKMTATFGTSAPDLLAAIGPSLGPCCAEFIHYRREIPESFHPYRTGAFHFDFWAVSRDQLLAAGVRTENIAESNLCTRCRTDLFFSYRAHPITGRFATVIGLNE